MTHDLAPDPAQSSSSAAYVCPMHPEVTDDHASECPRCEMTLVAVGAESVTQHEHHEPAVATAPPPGAYTCPMRPEIVRDEPGRCPICGMHLERVMPSADDDSDLIAYRDMRRRFWISVPLSLAVLSLSMLHFPPLPDGVGPWVELLLATPVVVWCAGPFFVWAVQSVRHRSPNMWTLIGLGVAASYLYSVVRPWRRGSFPIR